MWLVLCPGGGLGAQVLTGYIQPDLRGMLPQTAVDTAGQRTGQLLQRPETSSESLVFDLMNSNESNLIL